MNRWSGPSDVQGGDGGQQLGGRGRAGPAALLEDDLAGREVGDRRHDVAAEVGVGEQRLEQPRDLARRHLAAVVGGDACATGAGCAGSGRLTPAGGGTAAGSVSGSGEGGVVLPPNQRSPRSYS